MADTMGMGLAPAPAPASAAPLLADDAPMPESPIWWLEKLTCKLLRDQPRMVLMDRYYRGDFPLPRVPKELRNEYRRMLADARLNFMRIVVTSPAERLNVQGFRPRGADKPDDDVWGWWLDNELDSDVNLTITNALSMGRGYLFVERLDGGEVRAQAEDPRMAITCDDPRNRHERAAGLRLWFDDWTQTIRADVLLPDATYHYAARAEHIRALAGWPQPWTPAFPIDQGTVQYQKVFDREQRAATFSEWQSQWFELGFERNAAREIPLIPMVNQPSTLATTDGESEIDDVLPTQNRINELLFDRQLAAWTAAYQQKWATGIDIPRDPETGKPVQPFDAAIDRLWADTNTEARFGAFPATELANYIDAIEADIKHLAVITRTPRHYLVESGQTPSGDSIKSAETGLVAKVGEKQTDYGRSLVELVRVRAALMGETSEAMETIWRDPEFRTLGELTDAVIKQKTAGLIPTRVAREKLGYSPSEIERMERLEVQEALVRDAAAAVTPPAAGVVGPAVGPPAAGPTPAEPAAPAVEEPPAGG